MHWQYSYNLMYEGSTKRKNNYSQKTEPKHVVTGTRNDWNKSCNFITCTYWFILVRLVCRPTSLAQAATFLRTVEDLAPTDFIFSCIFSQTRGTPMKAVGRTSFKVLTREPWQNKQISHVVYSSHGGKEQKNPDLLPQHEAKILKILFHVFVTCWQYSNLGNLPLLTTLHT